MKWIAVAAIVVVASICLAAEDPPPLGKWGGFAGASWGENLAEKPDFVVYRKKGEITLYRQKKPTKAIGNAAVVPPVFHCVDGRFCRFELRPTSFSRTRQTFVDEILKRFPGGSCRTRSKRDGRSWLTEKTWLWVWKNVTATLVHKTRGYRATSFTMECKLKRLVKPEPPEK